MTTPEPSCLVRRLSRYLDLTDRERALIAEMEKSEVAVAAQQRIVSAGQPTGDILLLKSGWAALSARTAGTSEVCLVRIYLPGEIIGLAEIGAKVDPHDITMLTEGHLCRFPHRRITDILTDLPRLGALFQAIISLDQTALRDRLAVQTLGSARARLAFFLVDLHARLLRANPDMGRRYRLPMRQSDIGNAVGLTTVYVNRLLKEFEAEGLIDRQRPYIRLLNQPALAEMCGHVNRFDNMDTSWFPDPI
ncbi:Crp/Fnr family transcriptional regulator [Mesobaculum littorinae]|uniref:Crp/Fnr family transcriptional regulator n=1 Tax=Mesobaculum littorinae TaxID=2486419 RepID=A0A438AJM1_9RHOB|nr:Crp/Fnr family transcriptional regulator [Mesobaculum littorinae]RVV98981.1 Crp/Fnr family transcriptional regulator [Mesobaculum littorinae]